MRSGMIGSLARRSTKTKATIITAANERMPTIWKDSHSYSIPPSDRPTRSGTTIKTSSAMPA